MQTQLNQLQRQRAYHFTKKGRVESGYRQSRTRTLIQMGGLVDKLNLPMILGIELGEDLQEDFEQMDKAATLLGFLHAAKEHFMPLHEMSSEQQEEWQKVGKRIMKTDYLKRLKTGQ